MEDPMEEILGVTGSDGPPPGEEAWKEQTKGIERVIDVALTLQQRRTAEWVADEAAVAEQTARDHLDMLSELGVIAKTTARGVTKYQRDRAYIRFKEVSGYIERYDKDELMDAAQETKEQIETTQGRYDVETADELRQKVTEDGTTSEEVAEYKKAASEFETLHHTLDVISEALDRYEMFHRKAVTA